MMRARSTTMFLPFGIAAVFLACSGSDGTDLFSNPGSGAAAGSKTDASVGGAGGSPKGGSGGIPTTGGAAGSNTGGAAGYSTKGGSGGVAGTGGTSQAGEGGSPNGGSAGQAGVGNSAGTAGGAGTPNVGGSSGHGGASGQGGGSGKGGSAGKGGAGTAGQAGGPSIPCGDASCPIPAQFCCSQLWPGGQKDCLPAGAECGNNGTPIYCNGPSACPNEYCCGFHNGIAYDSVQCDPSCEDENRYRLCDPADSNNICPDGTTCQPSVLLDGLNVCRS